jgi:chorismate mutase
MTFDTKKARALGESHGAPLPGDAWLIAACDEIDRLRDEIDRLRVDGAVELVTCRQYAADAIGSIKDDMIMLESDRERIRDEHDRLRSLLREACDQWEAWLTAEGRGPQPQRDRLAQIRAEAGL